MKCPDCRRQLPDIATACRCGWVAEHTAASTRPNCCRCDDPAIVRVGDEMLCETHYVGLQNEPARKHFAELGLERATGESQSAWTKRIMAHVKSKMKIKTFGAAGMSADQSEDEWAA